VLYIHNVHILICYYNAVNEFNVGPSWSWSYGSWSYKSSNPIYS